MFTIGADPEFFIAKSGVVIPAHGAVPGTKEEPHKVEDGAIQVDGLALEVNIEPVPLSGNPSNAVLFSNRVAKVVAIAKAKAEETVGRVSVFTGSYNDFGKEVIDALPETAKELGCDPDWNAYTLKPNERPDGDVTYRVVGGHIHIGWDRDQPVDDPDYIAICANLVKVLDCFVGIPMKVIDGEERRRQMYGKAGAFRPKPYGVEYRSPSNFWITSASRRKAVYEMVNAAVQKLSYYGGDAERTVAAYSGKTCEEIREIIDDPDGRLVAASLYQRSLVYNSNAMDGCVRSAVAAMKKAA